MKKLLLAAALAAFVTSPAAAQYQLFATAPSQYIVVADGQIIGQDPDPNVRLELRMTALNNDGIY
jgi:hypothetical protein